VAIRPASPSTRELVARATVVSGDDGGTGLVANLSKKASAARHLVEFGVGEEGPLVLELS